MITRKINSFIILLVCIFVLIPLFIVCFSFGLLNNSDKLGDKEEPPIIEEQEPVPEPEPEVIPEVDMSTDEDGTITLTGKNTTENDKYFCVLSFSFILFIYA